MVSQPNYLDVSKGSSEPFGILLVCSHTRLPACLHPTNNCCEWIRKIYLKESEWMESIAWILQDDKMGVLSLEDKGLLE